MKKNSKLEGCYKRVPVAVKELANTSRRHFGAIFKKVSISLSQGNANKGGTTGLISRPLAN